MSICSSLRLPKITYIITHHGLGGFSGPINGLIAAAIGALSMLMSEPTAESYVKRTCMFVLSIATFTFTFTFTGHIQIPIKVPLRSITFFFFVGESSIVVDYRT